MLEGDRRRFGPGSVRRDHRADRGDIGDGRAVVIGSKEQLRRIVVCRVGVRDRHPAAGGDCGGYIDRA